jgi:cell wall-associated NlpC family hydrolase
MADSFGRLRLVFSLFVLLGALCCPVGHAANLTYTSERLVGVGSASISITTDGSVGTLSRSNIVDWVITVRNGSEIATITGPLSGDNSLLSVVGSALSATSSGLFFNFDLGSYAYVLFQLKAYNSLYCLDTSGCGLLGESLLASVHQTIGNGVTNSPRTGLVQFASRLDGRPLTASDLARKVVGADYVLGAKGWDTKKSLFVSPESINTGYSWSWSNTNLSDNVLDCSGLIFWSNNTIAGATQYQSVSNPVYYEGASGQFLHNTQSISENDLKAGDLLFFGNLVSGARVIDHVAMYVGCCGPNGSDVIHASSPTVGIIWGLKDLMKQSAKFAGFRRLSAPQIGVQVIAHSPIGLKVIDPDGYTITPDTLIVTPNERLREVPGILYYSEFMEPGHTSLGTIVTTPLRKDGTYTIIPVPKSGVGANDTYSVDFVTNGKSIRLADNVSINNIPSLGYGVVSKGSEVSAYTPIAIDIKPFKPLNSANAIHGGFIPVAILSTRTFDAPNKISKPYLTFGRTGDERSFAGCMPDFDVNKDGLRDVVCLFDTRHAGFQAGDRKGVLKGRSKDGSVLMGFDSINFMVFR